MLLGYGALILALALTVFELQGRLNLVPESGSSELLQIAPVIGAFGSIALSFGLLILYGRQTRILEQQYKPYLTGEIDNRSPVTTQFTVRNTGSDYAYDMEATWEVAGDKRTWETESLAPGDAAEFPIIVDENGEWIMGTQQIRDYLDDRDATSEIEYTITCKDKFGIPRRFSGDVDFDIISKKEESNQIWDTDPMESVANSISSIDASLDSLASDVDDAIDARDWENRWSKNQAILSIVSERETISISVLSRMVSIREPSLEYRLSELEEAGYLNYDKGRGVVKAETEAGENHTLSEFS